MPNRYVRMDILTNGADKAKKSLDELYLESERLDGKTIDMDARLKSTDFQATADELKRKADILNKYRIEMTAKIGGTDKADAQLLGIRANIDSIYHKLDEKHDISVGGLAKLNADLIKTKMLIDSLPNRKDIEIKTTDRVTETERKGFITRARNVAGGRSSMSELLPGGRGGNEGSGLVSGTLSGGVGQGLASAGPYAIGGIAGLLASLLPSVSGLAAGGAVGVGGAAGAIVQSKALQKQGKDILSEAIQPTTSLIAPLKDMFAQIQGFLAGLSGPLSKMFKDSAPFLQAFLNMMEQGAKIFIPAFTQVMMQMVKSGALKQMTVGIVALMKGLAGLLIIMGPEMKTSANVFVGVMKVVQGILLTVGIAVDSMLSVFRYMGKTVQSVGKIFADVIHGDFGGAFRAIMEWVHNIEQLFGEMRHVVATALDNMGFAKFGHAVANTFDKIRHDVAAIWDATWHWVENRFANFLDTDTHKLDGWRHDISHIFDVIRSDVKNIWDDIWKWVGQRLDTSVHFVENVLGDLRHSISTAFDNIRSSIHNVWDDTWDWVGNRLQTAKNFELHVIDDLRSGIAKGFQNIKHDVTNIWTDVWNDVHNIASSAITRLGAVLDRVKNAFNAPFAWVGTHVLEPLANAWNWIGAHTGHVLPKMPSAFHLAKGGRINVGSGPTADDVPAMISRGETVVSAAHSNVLAPVFRAVGVPGYADGGIPNPISAITGAVSGWGHDLGSVFGMLGRGALSTLEHIPGIAGLSSIMGPIAKGAESAASHAATTLVNHTLAARPEMMTGAARATGDLLIGRMANTMATAVQAESAVAGNGSTIAKYAEQFRGHPYVLGGSGDYQTRHSAPFGPWDCAGFVGQMYHHYGIDAPFPGINVGSLRRWAKFVKTPEVGGMAFFVTDGTKANPGHVGMVTGKNKSIQAMDPALGTRDSNLAGALDFAVPPHGWGTAAGSAGAVGKGYVNIGKGLMREGFGRGAAAGIVGDIAGESGGNPESVGSGGGGLIGWTPISSAPNKIITGNAARDMATQVADIKTYVERNGSMGDMNRFKDAVEAARWFSIHYERPAVNYSDVRPDVARSTYAALDTGEGWLGQGLNLVYNGLGRREHLVDPDRYKNQGGGSGGDCYHITVNGAVDGDATAKQIVQLINQRARHNGGRTGLVKN